MTEPPTPKYFYDGELDPDDLTPPPEDTPPTPNTPRIAPSAGSWTPEKYKSQGVDDTNLPAEPMPPPSDNTHYEYLPSKRSASSMRINQSLVNVFLGLLLVVLVFAGATYIHQGIRGAVGDFFSGIGAFLSPQPPTATTLSSQTLLTRMQPMGQLVSTNAQFAKADITVNVNQGGLGTCNYGASYVAEVHIDAGIDLYDIQPEDVAFDESTDTYTLRVPSPVLTSCNITYFDAFDERNPRPGCNPNMDDARQIAEYVVLTQIRDEAIAEGFLRTAERDTRIAISTFVSAVTQKDVRIEFLPATESLTLGSTCNGRIPNGWSFDSATNSWSKSN